MSFISDIIAGVVSPVTNLLAKKEERKQAHQAANSALTAAQEANEHDVVVNDQHLEQILADKTATTWRDEYVTVSLIGIINAIIIGGVLQGFGFPEFLRGVLIGVTALTEMIDLKWAMNAAVASSLGFSIWRKL
jgi:hypothetical protein